VLEHFRWVDGHGDVWVVLADGRALGAVVEALAAPWADAGVTHVAGLEARGFAVGAPTAVALGAGFLPVRKRSLPGRTVTAVAAPDHRGVRHELHLPAVLGPRDRALLVDDWAQRGSQAETAAELVRRQGAELLGPALVVEELPDDVRARVGRVTALATRAELGDPDGR